MSKSSALSSSAQTNDVLCSGADGVYDVSFFAASISHTAERSRKVFGQLSERLLSELEGVWSALSEDEQRAYLLETHEFAHHALMYSTPAGVLNWRLNQVISRDISWIFKKCDELSLPFPDDVPPQKVLASRDWQAALKRRADIDRQTKRYRERHVLSSARDHDGYVRVRREALDEASHVVPP